MDKLIIVAYGLFLAFCLISIIILIIKRQKKKKGEHFEKREN